MQPKPRRRVATGLNTSLPAMGLLAYATQYPEASKSHKQKSKYTRKKGKRK